MHVKPILLDVVPISFAVLLRLHRFRPRSGVGAVLGRGIYDTIAESVHRPSCWASGFSRPNIAGTRRPLSVPPSDIILFSAAHPFNTNARRRFSMLRPPNVLALFPRHRRRVH